MASIKPRTTPSNSFYKALVLDNSMLGFLIYSPVNERCVQVRSAITADRQDITQLVAVAVRCTLLAADSVAFLQDRALLFDFAIVCWMNACVRTKEASDNVWRILRFDSTMKIVYI